MQSAKIVSTTHQMSVRSFYDQYLKDGRILLQPEYQRDFTWLHKKHDLLIDSIIQNYIMPAIVLVKLDDTQYNGEYDVECLDGQHRLTVIKHYISGKKLNGRLVRLIDEKVNPPHAIFYDKKQACDL
jgi:hypothetical protein